MKISLWVLLFVFLGGQILGCSHQFPEIYQGTGSTLKEINLAENSLAKKEFKKAELEFKKLLKLYPAGNPEYEIVLFNLGLLYSDPDNPGKDFSQANEYFHKLIKIYPNSHFRTSMIFIQQNAEELRQIKSCKKENHRLQQCIAISEKNIKQLRSEIEQYKKIDWEREEKKRQIQR